MDLSNGWFGGVSKTNSKNICIIGSGKRLRKPRWSSSHRGWSRF